MTLKFFWSWQSDLHGRIGRHFVKAAITAALDEISSELAFEHEERPEVDHDTKGTTGSPDLFPTILEKIRSCFVFIADISLSGKSNDSFSFKRNGDKLPDKKFINSNVAIELGYALAQLPPERLILVFNSYTGSHEELPFDIKHKGGIICYELSPSATKEDIQKQKDILVSRLKSDFSILIANKHDPNRESRQLHEPSLAQDGYGLFCKPGTSLGYRDGLEFKRNYLMRDAPYFFFKLFPKYGQKKLSKLKLRAVMESANLPSFHSRSTDSILETNEFGITSFSSFDQSQSNCAVDWLIHLAPNSELWAVNFCLLESTRSKNGSKIAPSLSIIDTFRYATPKLFELCFEKLHIAELNAFVGVNRVVGYKMAMQNDFFDDFAINVNNVVKEKADIKNDKITQTEFIEDFLDELFEEFGVDRSLWPDARRAMA